MFEKNTFRYLKSKIAALGFKPFQPLKDRREVRYLQAQTCLDVNILRNKREHVCLTRCYVLCFVLILLLLLLFYFCKPGTVGKNFQSV